MFVFVFFVCEWKIRLRIDCCLQTVSHALNFTFGLMAGILIKFLMPPKMLRKINLISKLLNEWQWMAMNGFSIVEKPKTPKSIPLEISLIWTFWLNNNAISLVRGVKNSNRHTTKSIATIPKYRGNVMGVCVLLQGHAVFQWNSSNMNLYNVNFKAFAFTLSISGCCECIKCSFEASWNCY